MRTLRVPHFLLFLLVSALACIVPAASASKADDAAYETKMGSEAAADIEKQVKIIQDPALQSRLDTIGKTIAELANTQVTVATYGSSRINKFDYIFKIADDKEVNAFALPGGRVYVNKGLLDFVQSDHELAGVLAHEITHASHHHMLALLREQSKMNNQIALVLLAAIVGKMPNRDLGNVVMGAQLVQIAKMSTYGQKAEEDADRTAVDYLAKTQYNPVGILTFIERLSGRTELMEDTAGILMTHPSTGDRRATIIAELNRLNIPINRRKVTSALKAVVKTTSVDGHDVVEIAIEDKVVMKVADGEDGNPAATRAQQIADRVNDLLDSGVQLREVKAADGEAVVLAKEKPFIRISDEDASLSGSNGPQAAKSAAEVIRSVIWKQMVDLAMIPTATKRQ